MWDGPAHVVATVPGRTGHVAASRRPHGRLGRRAVQGVVRARRANHGTAGHAPLENVRDARPGSRRPRVQNLGTAPRGISMTNLRGLYERAEQKLLDEGDYAGASCLPGGSAAIVAVVPRSDESRCCREYRTGSRLRPGLVVFE